MWKAGDESGSGAFLAIDDLGPAEHWHGREREWHTVGTRLQKAEHDGKGTIVLVRGAPGAGKSALLHEFGKRAEKANWRVVRITGRALYDPVTLALNAKTAQATTRFTGKIGIGLPGFLKGQYGKGRLSMRLLQTAPIERIVARLSKGHAGLLLLLDEVQALADRVPTNAARAHAGETLESIHEGKLGVPVVLLAAGLDHSMAELEKFGISRLMQRGGLINLGRMSKCAEHHVIRDWLVAKGGAVSVDPISLEHWIETVAHETEGWPQHVICYASSAAEWLSRRNGDMPTGVPAEVLEAGRQAKVSYYNRRVQGMDRTYRVALSREVAATGATGNLSKDAVLDAFKAVPRLKALDDSSRLDTASKVFDLTVAKGIVRERDDGLYQIPIPSMRQWLVSTYCTP